MKKVIRKVKRYLSAIAAKKCVKALKNKTKDVAKAAARGLGLSIILIGMLYAIDAVSELRQASNQSYVEDNVVKLLNPDNLRNGGTGFVVKAPSGKLYTLTNAHVCALRKEGKLIAQGEYRNYSLSVIEVSKLTDLCVLEAVPGKKGLTVGGDVYRFERLSATGHPHLRDITTTSGDVLGYQSVALAIGTNSTEAECDFMGGKLEIPTDIYSIAAGIQNQCVKRLGSYRTTIQIYPGSSGSPALDKYGNVVGVMFAADLGTIFSYMVTLSDLKEFLRVY